MKRIAVICLAIAAVAANGQTPFRQSLAQMKIEQKLGSQVPAEARFMADNGQPIKMAEIFGERPIILLPMFFQCRGICGKETDNLLKTIARMEDKQVGRDFDVVLLSIHPKENAELAHNKKQSLLKVMKGDRNEAGYHFLTGEMDEIRKVTEAVGFGFDYDPKDGRINHPAGLVVLTPGGRVSQYIMGAEYPKPVVEQALALAQQDQVGKEVDTVLLGCVMIDPITGQRSIVIEGVVRLVAGLFALCLFGWIGMMVVKGRRAQPGGSPTSA